MSAADIHCQITEVYGTEAVSDSKVRKWVLKFKGQSQTNAVKAQGYGSSVLGPARYFAGGLMPQKITVNSSAYCVTLRKLRRELQNKRCNMLSNGVLLLHDNARPPTSRTTRELIESFGWEVLDHALCSPDLAPSDFPLLRYFKHSLGGERFSDNKEMKAAVNS
ncbi:histone-lysine N-methyltransferase SETMAR [Trichonephila clavipes]|uniref:Histone-lysine N-methyltransferase SETMAR n=1 Tax=Trichonephila clavipes TaxID=2585209 RepID=A0A8X6R8D8_TRICX|nr:histone-lysine N-methyltransferase SETMAR [Trichonephila clavipes]